MNDIIFYAIQLVIAAIAFFAGKHVSPKNMQNAISAVGSIYTWAQSFAAYCARFRPELSGEEKMEYLIDCVDELCKKSGTDFSREQIAAVGQLAYEELKTLINKEETNG